MIVLASTRHIVTRRYFPIAKVGPRSRKDERVHKVSAVDDDLEPIDESSADDGTRGRVSG